MKKLGLLISAMIFTAKAIAALAITDPQKAIMLEKGTKTVQLILQGNAGTGYAWFLVSYDHALLTPESYQWIPSASQLAGAPNQSVWTFTVSPNAYVVPQTTQITMAYLRPWEKDTPENTVFDVRFV